MPDLSAPQPPPDEPPRGPFSHAEDALVYANRALDERRAREERQQLVKALVGLTEQVRRVADASQPVELAPVEHVSAGVAGCETPETHNWGCPCEPAIAAQWREERRARRTAEQRAVQAEQWLADTARACANPEPPTWGNLADTVAALDARAGQVEDTLARVRAVFDDLTDPDPCYYDHHGHCQAHGWTATDPPCPHARAKQLLAGQAANRTAGEVG